jgi:hypothetical protein
LGCSQMELVEVAEQVVRAVVPAVVQGVLESLA